MKQHLDLSILIALLISFGCQNKNGKQQMDILESLHIEVKWSLYNFNKPDSTINLPTDLNEISGLTYSHGSLVAVQDEEGKIFKINLKNNKELEEHTFWKLGDYEGVCAVDNDIYITKSNGNLYKTNFSENATTDKLETKLKLENDCEGLAYWKQKNKLLIACKAYPGIKHSKIKKGKSVYMYDLERKSLDKKPLLVIKSSEIKKQNPDIKKKKHKNFAPSGIAIHPINGDIYILGHQGGLLLCYSKSGTIKDAVELDRKLFAQPEGICFAPDGTLFISNESAGNPTANILRFDMKK